MLARIGSCDSESSKLAKMSWEYAGEDVAVVDFGFDDERVGFGVED